jgi:hypothetical protein
MKTIIIKTQKDLDSLPLEFKDYTGICIDSSETIGVRYTYENATVNALGSSTVNAYNSSTVYAYYSSTVNALGSSTVHACSSSTVHAYNSSTVNAYDSSTVHAYNSSTVNAYLLSYIFVHSEYVTTKSLLDNSRLVYKVSNGQRPRLVDATAIISEYNEIITPTFDQWLERGVLYADGIYQRLVSQKTIGNVTIYETDQGYVARIGDKFAHGKTIDEAKNDLRYKLSDRDTSKYKSWKAKDVKTTDELIEAYMTITGACSFGTKQFCESVKLKDEYSINGIIELTKGRYGNEQFKEFFGD